MLRFSGLTGVPIEYFTLRRMHGRKDYLGSVALRAAVVASGLEDAIPLRLFVYVGFATAVALWLWLSLFGGQ